MPPQDNASGGPVIPAGTEPTVFGNKAFTPAQSGQPQVTQQTVANNGQPVIAPQVNANQNAPQGTTFAELAAKKGWTNPDQMADSYANLESHNKKVEMTAADIIKAVQVQPEQPQPVTAPVQTVTVQPNAAVNPDAQAIKIVEAIVDSRTKPLQQTVELQQLFLNNPDAKEYAAGIAEAVKRNPGIRWEDAYKLAKFDSAQQNATQQGQQDAYQTIQQKQSVIAGTPSPAQRSSPDISSIIKDRSVPFKEVDRIVRETLGRLGQ